MLNSYVLFCHFTSRFITSVAFFSCFYLIFFVNFDYIWLVFLFILLYYLTLTHLAWVLVLKWTRAPCVKISFDSDFVPHKINLYLITDLSHREAVCYKGMNNDKSIYYTPGLQQNNIYLPILSKCCLFSSLITFIPSRFFTSAVFFSLYLLFVLLSCFQV